MPWFRVTRSFSRVEGGKPGVDAEGLRCIIGGHHKDYRPGEPIKLEPDEVVERLD